ncbi:MAG: hypothetical protein ACRENC_19390, partial [Gemmatimonadaceae bacterium]
MENAGVLLVWVLLLTGSGLVVGCGVPTPSLTVQTHYPRSVNPDGKSAYGRGTTPDDVAAKNTSLRFHEGQHGAAALRLRWILSASVLGGLAAACWRGAPAAPPPALRPTAATDVVRDALRDDFAQHLSGRVFVEKYGRGSVTASGPPLGGDPLHRSPAEYVVVDPGTPPRIVAEERAIRFVLYVDPGSSTYRSRRPRPRSTRACAPEPRFSIAREAPPS